MLSRFVFVVALPSLIFASLSRISVAEFFNWSYIGALGGGMLAMYLVGLVVARRAFGHARTGAALHAMTAMYSSTAYIGLPLVLTLYGDAAEVPGIIGAIITGLVFTPLAMLMAEPGVPDQGRLRMLFRVISRPPLIAVAAALLVSASDVGVAAPVHRFFELLGGAFVPCALFAAGLFVARCSLRGASLEIGWLVSAKLLLHPLITWWLAAFVFRLDPLLVTVAVVQAGLPAGVPVFVLAQQYRRFESRSSAVIALSTALSVLSLSLIVALRG